MRLRSKSLALHVDSSFASPMVLMAESVKSGSNGRGSNVEGGTSNGSSTNNTTNELLLKLLGQLGNLGLNNSYNSATSGASNSGTTTSQPVAFNTNASPLPFVPPGPTTYYPTQQPAYIPLGPTAYYLTQTPLYYQYAGPPGFLAPQAQLTVSVMATQPANPSTGPTASTGPTYLPGQATILPHAFNAVTLQDPASNAWNMDIGLHDSTGASLM
ncbi:hypothetical protein Tco_1369659 [Tanacetum coccineum]